MSAPGPPRRIALGEVQGWVRSRRNGCEQVLLQLRRSPTSVLTLLQLSLQVGEFLPDLLRRQNAPQVAAVAVPPLRVFVVGAARPVPKRVLGPRLDAIVQ